jgi:hypothetical protein
MDSDRSLETTSKKTANDLRTIAHSQLIRELTPLSLPEIDAVVDLVARVVPAGNVPGVILNGLARLPGRRPPPQTVKRDINLLFKGVEQALDKALYTAFFAGPAAVIWGCQNLLKLACKDSKDAFPDGPWQFYVEYALRDGTAQHAAETHGFDTTLEHHHIHLREVDRMTACRSFSKRVANRAFARFFTPTLTPLYACDKICKHSQIGAPLASL